MLLLGSARPLRVDPTSRGSGVSDAGAFNGCFYPVQGHESQRTGHVDRLPGYPSAHGLRPQVLWLNLNPAYQQLVIESTLTSTIN